MRDHSGDSQTAKEEILEDRVAILETGRDSPHATAAANARFCFPVSRGR
jgi:hypothetical protein